MEVDSTTDDFCDNNGQRRRSCRLRRNTSIISPITSNTFNGDDDDVDMNCSSEDDFHTDGDSSYCGSLNNSDDYSSESDCDQQQVKLSLKKKVEIISLYDQDYSIRKLAKIFQCDRKLISNIITNRSSILKAFEDNNLEAITMIPERREQQIKTIDVTTNQELRVSRQFPRQYEAKSYLLSVKSPHDNKKMNTFQHMLKLDQCVMVIKGNDGRYSYQQLGRKIHCNVMLKPKIKKLTEKRILEGNKEGDQQISKENETESNLVKNVDFNQIITVESDEDDDVNKSKNKSLSSSGNENSQYNFQARKKHKLDTHKTIRIDCDEDDQNSKLNKKMNDILKTDRTVLQKTQDTKEKDCHQTIIIESDEEDDEANTKTDENCGLFWSVRSIPTNSDNEEGNNSSNSQNQNMVKTYSKSKDGQKNNNLNKLSLQKCEMVISFYDSELSYEELASYFNCSVQLITSIIKNRKTILKYFKKLKQKRLIEANKKNNDQIFNEIEIERNVMQQLEDVNQIMTVENNTDAKLQNSFQARKTLKLDTHKNVEIDCDDDDDHAGDNLDLQNVNSDEISCEKEFDITVMKIKQEPEEMDCQQTIIIESDEDDDDEDHAKTDNLSSSCIDKQQNDSIPSQQNPNNDKNHDDTINKIMTDWELIESVKETTNKNSNSPIQNRVDTSSKSVERPKTNNFNKLSLQKCVMLINYYDRKISYEKLATIFNCSVMLIKRIIKNRDTIFNFENILENLNDESDETENDRTVMETQDREDIDCNQTITHKSNDDQEKLNQDSHKNIRIDCDLVESDDHEVTSDEISCEKEIDETVMQTQEPEETTIERNIMQLQQLEEMDCQQTVIIESDEEDDLDKATNNLSLSCKDKLQNDIPSQQNPNNDTQNKVITDQTINISCKKEIDISIMQTQDPEEMDYQQTINIESDEDDDIHQDNAKTDNLSSSCRDELQNDIPSQQIPNNDTQNKVITDCNPIESDRSIETNSVNEETNIHLSSPIQNLVQSVAEQQTIDFNKLSLQQCVMVIKCYDRKFPQEKLASIFNCSTILIQGIIKNRDTLLNTFRKVKSNKIVVKKEFFETINQTTLNDELKQLEEMECNSTIIVLSDDDGDDENVDNPTTSIKKKQQNDSPTQQQLNCVLNSPKESEEIQELHIPQQQNPCEYNDPDKEESTREISKKQKQKLNCDLNSPKDSEEIEEFRISNQENQSPKSANNDSGNEDATNEISNKQDQHSKNMITNIESSNETDSSDDSLQSYCGYSDLSLENRVKLIRAHDKEVPYAKLKRWFNYSFMEFQKILENRDGILKAYAKTKKLKAPKSNNLRNYLTLSERVAIIEAVDRNVGRNEICRRFNCARNQIITILTQRDDLLSLYKESLNGESSQYSHTPNLNNCVYLRKHKNTARCNVLNLEERIGVIKAYSRKMSKNKMACIFNCSEGQITNILLKRKSIIEDYKELYPDLYENDKELQLILASNRKIKRITRDLNILPLHKRVEVIKAYEQDPNYSKLSRWFECSKRQIKFIIKGRESILLEYNKDN